MASCPACGGSFRIEGSGLPETVEEVRQFGRFLLLGRVGQGSFGTVWRARDPELGRLVALKIPHGSLLSSPRDVERCLREARAAAALRHPGIVTLHEVLTLGGRPVLVYDFIDGLTLEDLLRLRRLTFREAAGLVAEVAEAMAYAHYKGVVHRDIKPGNIMVEFARLAGGGSPPTGALPTGKPVIVDFGLALREEAEVVLSVDGQIIGTPAYMSPEQAAGKGSRADERSDVYGLGVVLYELLCGELPFRGTKLALLHQVVHEEPRPPRRLNDKVPRDLETICLKAMAKEPGRRYQTARDFADDLRRYLRGESVQARPAGRLGRGWRWCKRNPALAGALALALLSLLGGAAGVAAFAVREHQAKLLSERGRYVLEMNLAHLEWKNGQLDLAKNHLDAWIPSGGAADLRGFEWHYLQRMLRLDLATWHAHDGPVNGLAYSPDGRWLASAGDDKAVVIWNVAEGREEFRLPGHGQPVRAVAFSPDGRSLASVSCDPFQKPGPAPGEVKVWDLEKREAVSLTGHRSGFWAIAFSPDGGSLACGGGGSPSGGGPGTGEVVVWDLKKSQRPASFSGCGKGVIRAIAFSPDGRRLAAGGDDMAVRVWDVARPGAPRITLRRHTAPVWGLAFGRDGRMASAGIDRAVFIWDLPETRDPPFPLGVAAGSLAKQLQRPADTLVPQFTLREHKSAVFSAAFSPDGRHLASAGSDRVVRLWDARTGEPGLVLRGHTAIIKSVVFSPDGWRMASASEDGIVKIWEVAGGREPAVLSGEGCAAAKRDLNPFDRISCVAFSPDGRNLAAAAGDRTVKVWDVDLGRLVRTLRGHVARVCGVAFSPDGLSLASAGDKRVKVWAFPGGANARTLTGHDKEVKGVAYSPDGGRLASFSGDGRVVVWDAGSGVQILALGGPPGEGNGARSISEGRFLSFSPDGRFLASAGVDRTVKVWDLTTGSLRHELLGHTAAVYAVAFSPDGRQLASGGRGHEVILWDFASGNKLRTFHGHTGWVKGVAFSPDGQRLVSGANDRTVRIWDTKTGQQLLSLEGHEDDVTSVAFCPDRMRIASGSADGTVRIWDARPWTPEVAEQWQAVGLLEHLFRTHRSKDEVIARVREDPTISEAVRERALQLLRP